MFLTRFGFIVGWTVLIATFLSKVGIDWLPALFLINAVLVMLGTLIYRKFIHRIKREILITFTVLTAAAFLISSIFFINTHAIAFFALLMIAESVLLAQLTILLSLFNEELFSPLESQRTFPIIESAETIGGIAGGLTLSLFANTISPYKFVIIWAIAILMILPIVLKYNANTMDIPSLEKETESKSKDKKTRKNIKELTKNPFVKGLVIVIILHWAIMNMVEYQYTKAIQEDVYTEQENTLVLEEKHMEENHTEEIILADTEEITIQEAHLINEEAFYEHQLTQKLGFLHMVFNTIALAIQLLLASRIITSLGVISTMLLHPILTLLNMVGLTLRFGFFTAALTRGSYELTGLMFKDTYDSSYYAIPHSKRDDVKEMIQGIMKPLGAIIGTVAIMLVALKLSGAHETLAINIILIVLGLAMAIVISQLSHKYTAVSEKNLSRKTDLPTRLNAIEILAQKGHEKITPSLRKILERENEPTVIKIAILKTLGAQKDHGSISSILKMMKHEETEIRLAAIDALSKFETLTRKKMDQSFTKYGVLRTLEKRLKDEKNEIIREKIIKYYHEVAPEELTKYLVESINSKNDKKSGLIHMLKLFKDPNLVYYLEKYLEDKNPNLKAASIIALWQFKEMHSQLNHYLEQLLESKKLSHIKAGIFAAGHINTTKLKRKIKKFLNHSHKEVREAAVLALARLEDEQIIPHMVAMLSDPEHRWFKQTAAIISSLPEQFKRTVEAQLHIHISDRINEMLDKHKSIKKMDKESLRLLKALYHKINGHYEAHKIESQLDYQEDS